MAKSTGCPAMRPWGAMISAAARAGLLRRCPAAARPQPTSASRCSGAPPVAAFEAESFHTPAFSEADPSGGGFGLAYNADTATDTQSELGARFDNLLPIGGGALIDLRAKAAWVHEFANAPSLVAAFE